MTTQQFKAYLGRSEFVTQGSKVVGNQLVREPGFTSTWHRNGFVIWAKFNDEGIATKIEIAEETDAVSWSQWFVRQVNCFFR